jgi:Ca2+:H+ antiporter
MTAPFDRLPWWTWAFPVLGWVFLLLLPKALAFTPLLLAIALVGTVFAAVHHAEVLAHRVGEPFGSLLLAIAVTVIEVALIVSLMLGDPAGKAGLARDTVFAALMIVCNGLVGLCLLVGGARHHEQEFRLAGASAMLSVLVPMAVLVLVMPNLVAAAPGPFFSPLQLGFVSAAALALYLVLLFVQTVRHRDYFLPETGGDDAHAPPPPARQVLYAAVLLPVALLAVVLIAKSLSPALEAAVAAAGAPGGVVGVAIALLVLLPESLAAVRAARRNRLQTSLNLALGSVAACIGLTIPTVAGVSFWLGQPLSLGLGPAETLLLGLTFLVAVLTLGTGRTTVLQGAVHLVIFAVFVFLVFVP